ncbi:MAG: hypothetical protein LQ348_004960 [Seirophora lacunosa]|nr:MAG: hypothetical protein LQ348_004960 [Seirophora lacunosa]
MAAKQGSAMITFSDRVSDAVSEGRTTLPAFEKRLAEHNYNAEPELLKDVKMGVGESSETTARGWRTTESSRKASTNLAYLVEASRAITMADGRDEMKNLEPNQAYGNKNRQFPGPSGVFLSARPSFSSRSRTLLFIVKGKGDKDSQAEAENEHGRHSPKSSTLL